MHETFRRLRHEGLAAFFPRPVTWLVDLFALIFLPFLTFSMVETLFQLPRDHMKPAIMLGNYVLYLLFLLFFTGISGRLKWGVRIFSVFGWFIGTLNYAVIAFRSTPIVPWDLKSANTAISVAGNYDFPFTGTWWMFTFIMLLQIVLAEVLTWRAKRRTVHLAAALATALALFGAVQLAATPWTLETLGLDNTLFNQHYMSRHNGFLLNFTHCFHYQKVGRPSDYSPQRVEALTETYRDKILAARSKTKLDPTHPEHTQLGLGSLSPARITSKGAADRLYEVDAPHEEAIKHYLELVNAGTTRELAPGERPDVVIVMNESFSDMRNLYPYETNLPVLSFYEGAEGNLRKGITNASVVGGNTATTEFEFLTGCSMAFLPSGSIAYQQYIDDPIPTLATLLREQGYSTVAMHPYHAGGWERDRVYPLLGFEEMKFLPDFRNQDTLRRFISDRALFQEILDELPAGNDLDAAPRFVFTVSMQNHGGYTQDFDDFHPEVEITDKESSKALNSYLSLIRESDRMLGSFLATLQQRDRPTLVYFFGDHQPNNYTSAPLSRLVPPEDLDAKRRRAVYMVWANYRLDNTESHDTSMQYLGLNMLLDAKLALSPWYAFLQDAEEAVPAINDAFMYLPDGTRRENRQGDPPPILKDYEILQYNCLFDKEHRVDELFRPVPYDE